MGWGWGFFVSLMVLNFLNIWWVLVEFWKFCTTDSWPALCESNAYYCSLTSVTVGKRPELCGQLDVPIANILTIGLPALSGYCQTPRAPSNLSGLESMLPAVLGGYLPLLLAIQSGGPWEGECTEKVEGECMRNYGTPSDHPVSCPASPSAPGVHSC